MWRLWTALAWEDLRQRFRRSYVGVLWITISFSVFIFVKFLIFSQLSTSDAGTFLSYVTVGYFVWAFLSSIVTDAPYTFVMSEAWIKSGRLPLTVFALQNITRHVVQTSFTSLVVLGVILSVGVTFSAAWILSLVAFLIMLVNSLTLSIILGSIAARQRDIAHFVQTIMRVMFFATPIVWEPERMGELWRYLQYNPLAHFVIAFRQPLIDGTVPTGSFIVVGGVTIVGLLCSMIVFAYARRRIVYWL